MEYYKRYCIILKQVIKDAKRMSIEKEISKSRNMSKTVWGVVKRESGRGMPRQCIKWEILNNNIVTTDKVEISNLFANHFTNIAVKHKFPKLGLPSVRSVQQSFFLTPVTISELHNIIYSLNNTNSTGVDEMPLKFLRESCPSILNIILDLINGSFQSFVFPDQLKLSRILPIYKKKGMQSDVENYRPVSLVNVITKIIERAVSRRLLDFFSINGVMTSCQHGFRSEHSTESAIRDFLGEVYDVMNEGKSCVAIVCDLSKAFDMVDHAILLHKLEKYGIRGDVHKWFESYLENRQQFVSLEENNQVYNSNANKVLAGVPQGSVLGPLLFNLYVNDLPQHVSAKTVMYADDTTCILSDVSADALLSKTRVAVQQLSEWFTSNRLLLNLNKTNIMIFNEKSLCLKNQISINTVTINVINEAKILGLIVDSKLKFEQHISKLNKKLNSACYTIRCLLGVISFKSLRSVYYGYFHSLMTYAIQFWGNIGTTQSIFRTQKRCLRIMLKLDPRASCRDYFKQHKILTMICCYIHKVLLMVHKNKKNILSTKKSNNYDLRKDLLRPNFPNSTKYINSPFYKGLILYNLLPETLKTLSINKFKERLKRLLLENAFYTLDEFQAFLA